MPREQPLSKPKKRVAEEYGCASYGCVMPTGETGVVFKLTTDRLEADFIKEVIERKIQHQGLVTYYGVAELQDSHQRRRVFVIWREEAYNVGQWLPYFASTNLRDPSAYEAQGERELQKHLSLFMEHADHVRSRAQRASNPGKFLQEVEKLGDWAWDKIGIDEAEHPLSYGRSHGYFTRFKGAQRAALHLRAAKIIAEMMSSERAGYLIGEALDYYLDEGILLCDVHGQNMGQVKREEYGNSLSPRVITDPGHALFLKF